MQKCLRAALKLATDRSKSDTCHYRLFTLHSPYFSVRSSRSDTALRAAILDECQNYLGGGGRFGRKREKQSLSSFDAHLRWLPVTQSLLRQDSLIILILQNSVGTFDHWSSQSLPKEISGAGKQHFPAYQFTERVPRKTLEQDFRDPKYENFPGEHAPRFHQVGSPSALQLSSLLACERFIRRYIIMGALKWNGL